MIGEEATKWMTSYQNITWIFFIVSDPTSQFQYLLLLLNHFIFSYVSTTKNTSLLLSHFIFSYISTITKILIFHWILFIHYLLKKRNIKWDMSIESDDNLINRRKYMTNQIWQHAVEYKKMKYYLVLTNNHQGNTSIIDLNPKRGVIL